MACLQFADWFDSDPRIQTFTRVNTTIAEVKHFIGLSERTDTKLFEKEPRVLIWEEKRQRKRALYRTIRIPRRVYERGMRGYTLSEAV